jgi:mono/diheme cytochrome c family protein
VEVRASGQPLQKGKGQGLAWTRAGGAILALGGIALVMGQAKPHQQVPRVVEAERFVLRDSGGKVRAELACPDDRPCLCLLDEKGNCRTRLALLGDGSAVVSLYDADGTGRVVLRVQPGGEPSLDLVDKQGKARPAPAPPTRMSGDNPGRPAGAPPAAGSDQRLQAAEALYRRLCVRCHGQDGRGEERRASLKGLPDFTDPAWQKARTDFQLMASIRDGRGTDMPAYDDRLNAGQVRDLIAYIRAFGPAKGRPVTAPPDDFDQRWRQLQQQWDELQKQMQELRKH